MLEKSVMNHPLKIPVLQLKRTKDSNVPLDKGCSSTRSQKPKVDQ